MSFCSGRESRLRANKNKAIEACDTGANKIEEIRQAIARLERIHSAQANIIEEEEVSFGRANTLTQA